MADKRLCLSLHAFSAAMRSLLFLFGGCLCFANAIFAIGQQQYVTNVAQPGSFPIAQANGVASVYVDSQDWTGVIRAAGDLQSDIERVTSRKPLILHEPSAFSGNVIIVGTVGKSGIIGSLAAVGKIDVGRISGKWEMFSLQVVRNPLPNISMALVIAGCVMQFPSMISRLRLSTLSLKVSMPAMETGSGKSPSAMSVG